MKAEPGENFGIKEPEEKYQCLKCNSEEKCGAVLMGKTRAMQKEKKNDKIEEEEMVQQEEVTVSDDANRLNVGSGLCGECLPKEMYDAALAKKLTMLGSFKIMKTTLRYLARLRKVKLTYAEIEGDAWRILLRLSQTYYKVKERKDNHDKMYHGIGVAMFRLSENNV